MELLSFGSANIDQTYFVDHIAREKETISCSKIVTGIGGKGLNQAIAGAKAKGVAKLAARISKNDSYIIDYLQKHNVDTSLVEMCDDDTGHAIIQLDSYGQNSIIVVPGANYGITISYIDQVFSSFNGNPVLLQNEINCIPEIMERARRADCTVVFNPSPFTDEIMNYPLELVDIFVINEVEGYEISGQRIPEDIITYLSAKYPYCKIVLTLGGDGAMFYDGERTYLQPIIPAEVVDTTAAGDTFVGYFISSYASGASPQNAMLIASQASSITVSRAGAAASIPLKNEVASMLENIISTSNKM